ncbi:MAG: helix-turn-helix domain-containing protein [Eggerthellaceae bacterium]|nr:helix-turn-helix domain-containing protein [Eggerthellaceae bacterium]
MLTVKEAAALLNVTEARVRNMIYDGVLPAEKFGNNWSIPDAAVAWRCASRPRRGRPKKDAETKKFSLENAEHLHSLYQECRRSLSNGYSIDMLLQLAEPEERDFCLAVTDFFLQKKQRQLVEEGVF